MAEMIAKSEPDLLLVLLRNAMSSSSPSPGNGSTTRKNVLKVLTVASHITSPFISTFLLVHLAAPVLANVGGTSLASQTMILGREYYQTPVGESLLVLGPIAAHYIAGISKRLLLAAPSGNQSNSDKSSPKLRPIAHRPLTSLLGLTGYATIFLFLPIHFFVHRDNPSLPIEPISSVGPSSLDYEYVKYGLRTWPWRSWFLYTGLVSSVALHAADGATLIWNTWFKDGWGNLSRKTRRAIAVGGVIVPVLLGLATVAREPPMIMSFLESRYHAAYTQSFAFQL
ncbi:hypothetical protein NP233_g4615 [Leucocoprinus birnbaumii]|uniref:Mitochondrial adapter protein MCP1 transmembrane domain-containing protein n=1 Tax=Leucocoprinus birnbaumii TaxID=56174 RepID=A0AAD5YRP9_9AGAR|nr:hypothetical protein NP233_g4615 [Leucocoprinus birnbaumii]